MNKFLFGLYFSIFSLLCSPRLYAQQFSQYNTGTLYDGFENPSQRTFTPDSSRKVGFNLLVPNINIDFTLSGNSQSAFKNRLFVNLYDPSLLTLGKKNYNYSKVNVNTYLLMLKFYTNLGNNTEIGFSGQSRLEGRAIYSDEAVQVLDDSNAFGDVKSNVFNVKYDYQAYHQLGVSYRTDVDEEVSFGIKLSALFGIVSNRVNIYRSNIAYDRPNDQAFLSLAGNYRSSFEPGNFTEHDIIASTRNPGASINLGVSYLTYDNYKFQFNLKDLGFIHWSSQSLVGNFDNTGIITGLDQTGLDHRVTQTALQVVQNNSQQRSFTTNTNAIFETSVARSFWLDDSNIKYTPTLIMSKELFYRDFSAAWVNHFQYRQVVGTLTASYDDMHYLNLGTQFMVKSPNMEFFIGSDRLGQSLSLAGEALGTSRGTALSNNRYSGANFYIGASIKFGHIIEHPLNANYIPMGPKRSVFKRVWDRIRGKED